MNTIAIDQLNGKCQECGQRTQVITTTIQHAPNWEDIVLCRGCWIKLIDEITPRIGLNQRGTA